MCGPCDQIGQFSVIMVSVCLPSDALSQHLPSYLGFSYLGHGVSLHGCSSKAQLLLLTLDKGYLLRAAPPDLEHGVAPFGPPAPAQLPLLGRRTVGCFSLSCIGEGNGNPLQCSYLENPRDGKPGGLPPMGSHRVGHD